jgi:muconolactone D-isomerase
MVAFDANVPDGAPSRRGRGAAERRGGRAKLAEEGHLVRIWKPPVAPGEIKALGLYRAKGRRKTGETSGRDDSETQLDGLLGALRLADWIGVTVTPLEPHPNDPGEPPAEQLPASRPSPDPGLPPGGLGATPALGTATEQG